MRRSVACVLIAACAKQPAESSAPNDVEPPPYATDPSNPQVAGMVGITTELVDGSHSAFWIDVFEVRYAAYGECVAAGVCNARVGTFWNGKLRSLWQSCTTHPENLDDLRRATSCVDHDDASTYCRWVGKRLPSAEEFDWVELCAAKVDRATPRTFTGRLGEKRTPTIPNCVHDLGGNRWEWTASAKGDDMIARGGGRYLYNPEQSFATDRARMDPTTRAPALGFRCALDL